MPKVKFGREFPQRASVEEIPVPFDDRQDAGDRLAARLEAYRQQNAIVLALQRGGVEVALPIALHLGAPLELLLVRKLGVPGYSEVAMGAIIDGDRPIVIRNEDVIRHLRISEATFNAAAKRELAEIERRRAVYYSGRPPISANGRIAIVVDDGIATGATVKAALESLRRKKPSKIVVAVPIAPTDFVEELKAEVDEIICLEPLGDLGAVGAHYLRFEQLSDDDVIALMAEAENRQHYSS